MVQAPHRLLDEGRRNSLQPDSPYLAVVRAREPFRFPNVRHPGPGPAVGWPRRPRPVPGSWVAW